MKRRYELSDQQYYLISDLLPENGSRGGQWNKHRLTLNGIFWILCSGSPWRDLPERYGKWQSVSDRFNRWRKHKFFPCLLQKLHLHLNDQGFIDPDMWFIDSTTIRASKAAAGASRKKQTIVSHSTML